MKISFGVASRKAGIVQKRGKAASSHRRPVLDTGLGFIFFLRWRDTRRMEKGGWVYIMANRYRGGMYVGVTADALTRVYQHREGTGSRHVADFAKTRLVYVERHDAIECAIAREKLVKKWRREWKFALIEADNPEWHDLWEQWFTPQTGQK